jgi:hypothetical protein
VHLATWVTVFFAVLERIHGARWSPSRPWTPDLLPEPPRRRARTAELIGETVTGGVFLTGILLTPVLPLARDADGHVIGLLSPWLWDTGAVYAFVVLVAAGIGFGFVRYYVRWTPLLAIVGALISLATAGVMLWVATHDTLINLAFVEAQSWPSTVFKWINPGLLVAAGITVVVALAQLVSGFANRSWAPADLGSMIRTSVAGFSGPDRR